MRTVCFLAFVFHTITEWSCFCLGPSWSYVNLSDIGVLNCWCPAGKRHSQAMSAWPALGCQRLLVSSSTIKHLSIPFVKFILLQNLLDLFSTFTSYSVSNDPSACSHKDFYITFGYKNLYGNSHLHVEYWNHFNSWWQEWDRVFGIWTVLGNLRSVVIKHILRRFEPIGPSASLAQHFVISLFGILFYLNLL